MRRRSPPGRRAITESPRRDVGQGERVVTSVARLAAGERREEIARMLAGAQVTREARAAAASLIEKAG